MRVKNRKKTLFFKLKLLNPEQSEIKNLIIDRVVFNRKANLDTRVKQMFNIGDEVFDLEFSYVPLFFLNREGDVSVLQSKYDLEAYFSKNDIPLFGWLKNPQEEGERFGELNSENTDHIVLGMADLNNNKIMDFVTLGRRYNSMFIHYTPELFKPPESPFFLDDSEDYEKLFPLGVIKKYNVFLLVHKKSSDISAYEIFKGDGYTSIRKLEVNNNISDFSDLWSFGQYKPLGMVSVEENLEIFIKLLVVKEDNSLHIWEMSYLSKYDSDIVTINNTRELGRANELFGKNIYNGELKPIGSIKRTHFEFKEGEENRGKFFTSEHIYMIDQAYNIYVLLNKLPSYEEYNTEPFELKLLYTIPGSLHSDARVPLYYYGAGYWD